MFGFFKAVFGLRKCEIKESKRVSKLFSPVWLEIKAKRKESWRKV